MKAYTLTTAFAATALGLSIWGTGAAQAFAPKLPATPAAAQDGSVVQAGFGGRRGMRGGRRGMMRFLQEADADNDGALTQAEIDGFIEAKVKAADADGDGDLTLKEFENVWQDMTRRRMVDAFQRLDDDGSGTITAAERQERFGGIVSRLDRNDDGKLSREDRRRRGHGDRRGRRGDDR